MYRRRSQSSLVGTFHGRRSPLMKTGLFRQVMVLKIQRKNPGGALEWNPCWEGHSGGCRCFTSVNALTIKTPILLKQIHSSFFSFYKSFNRYALAVTSLNRQRQKKEEDIRSIEKTSKSISLSNPQTSLPRCRFPQ
jgi:hypothetical protein